MHRADARLGPTETRPTTKYANASHKPPQQVHFSEAREPSRAAAKIHREMHPHVRRSFVTWTPEKSDGGWPAFACGQRGFVLLTSNILRSVPPLFFFHLSFLFFLLYLPANFSSFSSTSLFYFETCGLSSTKMIQLRAPLVDFYAHESKHSVQQ